MHDRCGNPQSDSYKNYGGRGITVCDRWKDIRAFTADMGDRPKGYSLERIDNDGNYEPGNCKWIPKGKQVRNRRVSVLNEETAASIRQECRRRIPGGYTDGLTRDQLAGKYGCSVATIKKVLDGNYWR